jgi:hypothetical protein
MGLRIDLLDLADTVLRRGSGSSLATRPGKIGTLPSHLLLILVFGTFYGGVMGTYGGVAGARFWQVIYSGLKVPILLLATYLLSLPSFFVFNTLLGLRNDFPRVVRSLVATQAGLTVMLASLAPITAFSYVSGMGYQPAILFNGLMFAVASVSAQWLLRREYRPLIEGRSAHRWMLRTWIFVYVFVGIQLGWVLRPFIGNPGAPVQFFREDSWSNAYVVVGEMIWKVIRRTQ